MIRFQSKNAVFKFIHPSIDGDLDTSIGLLQAANVIITQTKRIYICIHIRAKINHSKNNEEDKNNNNSSEKAVITPA